MTSNGENEENEPNSLLSSQGSRWHWVGGRGRGSGLLFALCGEKSFFFYFFCIAQIHWENIIMSTMSWALLISSMFFFFFFAFIFFLFPLSSSSLSALLCSALDWECTMVAGRQSMSSCTPFGVETVFWSVIVDLISCSSFYSVRFCSVLLQHSTFCSSFYSPPNNSTQHSKAVGLSIARARYLSIQIMQEAQASWQKGPEICTSCKKSSKNLQSCCMLLNGPTEQLDFSLLP